MVSERFDRDQHELLLRKLYSIKQTSSVTDYVTTFTTLVDQLTAYATSVDPIFSVTRFIDGLKPEIKAVVVVQRPKNLDTACTLAMLQDEAGGYPDPVWSCGGMAPGTHKTRHGLRHKGGPAHKIKACTARLHEDVIYCIIPNMIFSL